MILVTMTDIRTAKICSRGARSFFKHHNLDWNKFLREGIPVEELEATEDHQALRVCEVARGRQQ